MSTLFCEVCKEERSTYREYGGDLVCTVCEVPVTGVALGIHVQEDPYLFGSAVDDDDEDDYDA